MEEVNKNTELNKMHLQDKKFRKLKRLLNSAYKLSNDLVGEEETHSKNQNFLYKVREKISSSKQCLEFVSYNEK